MGKQAKLLLNSLPAVTGTLVAGIINASGGNLLQTAVGLIATATGVLLNR